MTHEEKIAEIDERLRNVAMHLELTASMVHRHDEQLDKAAKLLAQASDTMDRISRLIEAHEQRIEDLGDGQ
jgi:methyl-accepting chemotaxis protein